MMNEKKDNLKRDSRIPIIQTVRYFKDALEREDYERCGAIRAEMDRRMRLFLNDEKAFDQLFGHFDKQPAEISEDDLSDERLFSYTFSRHLEEIREERG